MKKKIIVREPSEHFKRKTNTSEIKESLLSENVLKSVRYIDIDELIPYSKQARIHFNYEKIDELASSIKEYGVRTPLTVIESDVHQSKFEVISGERRLRAAKMAGLDKLPCLIIEDSKDAEAIALIENIQRENLHPIEMGKAFKQLKEDFNINQDEVAKRLNISKSIVSEYIKFSNISSQAANLLIEKKVGRLEWLRSVSALDNDDDQYEKVLSIVSKKNNKKRKIQILNVFLEDGKLEIEEYLKRCPQDVQISLAKKIMQIIKENNIL
jgi:ParB family chromosome partitioning protein